MNFHLSIDYSIFSLHQASLTFLSLPQTSEDLGSVRSCCFGIITFMFGAVLLIQSHSPGSRVILNTRIWCCCPSARAALALQSQLGSVQADLGMVVFSLTLSFTEVALIFHLIAKIPTTPGCLCLPCY